MGNNTDKLINTLHLVQWPDSCVTCNVSKKKIIEVKWILKLSFKYIVDPFKILILVNMHCFPGQLHTFIEKVKYSVLFCLFSQKTFSKKLQSLILLQCPFLNLQMDIFRWTGLFYFICLITVLACLCSDVLRRLWCVLQWPYINLN